MQWWALCSSAIQPVRLTFSLNWGSGALLGCGTMVRFCVDSEYEPYKYVLTPPGSYHPLPQLPCKPWLSGLSNQALLPSGIKQVAWYLISALLFRAGVPSPTVKQLHSRSLVGSPCCSAVFCGWWARYPCPQSITPGVHQGMLWSTTAHVFPLFEHL